VKRRFSKDALWIESLFAGELCKNPWVGVELGKGFDRPEDRLITEL